MKTIEKKRWIGLLLAAAMLLAMLPAMGGGALASSLTPAPPGSADYVSMHNYMSKTDIPGVFKVTLSLQTPEVAAIKGPVYVAITLDYSGSMSSGGVWDSEGHFSGGTPANITRYKAIEAGVEATIDSLIADGNKQVYLNISTHDGNSTQGVNGGVQGTPTGQPLALDALADASGFTSLYDSTGALRPVFDKSDPNWIMTNWNLGMNSGGVGVPMPGSGWCGYYDMNDYAYPFLRIHKLFKDGLLAGNIPTYASKYVLCMGDGADYGQTRVAYNNNHTSMEAATALKAPLDPNFKATGGSATPTKTIMGVDGGIGAVIWGVTLGSGVGHQSDWPSRFFSVGAVWGSQTLMMGNSMIIPEADIPSIPTTAMGANSDTVIFNLYKPWYVAQGLTAFTPGVELNYTHSTFLKDPHPTTASMREGTSLMDGFADFGEAAAQAAISVHTGLEGSMKLNSVYDLYQYKSFPLVDLTSSDPATVQSYTISGNRNIEWHIDQLQSGSVLTMVFYVKMDDSVNKDLYYELFDNAGLTYIPSGETQEVTKFFPIPYARYPGDTKDGGSPLPGDSGAGGSGTGGSGTGTGISSPGSGAAGHQQNRNTANDMTSGFGGGQDISPDVKDVKSGKDSTGRTKVQVDLSNGSYMRYQWQFKNAAGEWEDIFGATGSHYTLGKQFTAGKDYELRAKITNPAGKVSFTDELKVNMEAGSGGGLQTREEGPGIVSENVSDAGEEIIVANTATNGQMLAILAGIGLCAALVFIAIAIRRRVK